MTICVPKKPFEILADTIWFIFNWFWAPSWIISGILLLNNQPLDWLAALDVLGVLSCIFCFVWWLPRFNEEHSLIKWCDKRENTKC